MAKVCSYCGESVEQNAAFCTHCGGTLRGKKPAPAGWHSKRRKILEKRSSGGMARWKIPVVVAIVSLFAVFVIKSLPSSANPVIRAQPVVVDGVAYPRSGQSMVNISAKIENGKIVVPLDALRERRFIAFEYNGPKGPVPLLAYVSGEGKIVTAVSICEPCNSKRFHISGTELICNSCGTKWHINTLEPISGSCGKYPPDALPSLINGNEVRIDEQIVANWQRRI
jgi:hypothetical protein